MDMSRRGFLSLIGATTAVTAMPRSLVTEPAVSAQPMRISQGLYVKSRGIVHFLGNIEAIAVETPQLWDFSGLTDSYKTYTRHENSNITFSLVSELETASNVQQLMYDMVDSGHLFASFNDYKMQVLAIMRNVGRGHSSQMPTLKDNKLDYQGMNGDILIAIDNTFIRDISDFCIPHSKKYADAPEPVVRVSTTFVMPSEGNYVSYYEDHKMKQLAGDKPALEFFGA